MDPLKPLCCIGITSIAIGMMFETHLLVGLLELRFVATVRGDA